MAEPFVLNYDLVNVYTSANRTGYLRTLAWGDTVQVLEQTPEHIKIHFTGPITRKSGKTETFTGDAFLVPTKSSGITAPELLMKQEDDRVLKVDILDVQQGDGAVIETPGGQVVLVDGGELQLFARYLAARFRDTSEESPKEIDCILITHGDADHFAGLAKIHESESLTGSRRLFIHPKRVFHNGLVKRPEKINGQKLKETELLGATVKSGNDTVITGLETDLLAVDDAQMNGKFREWKQALQAFSQRGPIEFRRLSQGDNNAFDFLAAEDIHVEVLGPIMHRKNGVEGLRFLGTPKFGPGDGGAVTSGSAFTGKSASHTINGHSIIFRLTYGGVHFLFTGDLNAEAADKLVEAHKQGTLNLRSELFKVPHHGSADFSPEFLEAVSPLVSMVSSGDENARTEYIHPRAVLMGGLGKFSRTSQPLIFVTELVAFFASEGRVQPEFHKLDADGELVMKNGKVVIDETARGGGFFGFSRAAFGIVRLRTDGSRIVVYTDSGKPGLFEKYAFQLDAQGEPVPTPIRHV